MSDSESAALNTNARRRKRTRIGILLVVLLVAAVIGGSEIWRRYVDGPDLLSRSHIVLSECWPGYQWLSNADILVLRPVTSGLDASRVTVGDGLGSISSRELPYQTLPGLNEQYNSGNPDTRIAEVALNGPQATMLRFDYQSSQYVATDLKGKKLQSWAAPNAVMPRTAFWENDGFHWIELRAVAGSSQLKIIRHALSGPDGPITNTPVNDNPIGLDTDGDLVCFQEVVSDHTENNLLFYNTRTGALKSSVQLDLPRRWEFNQWSISPRGDNIAMAGFTGGGHVYPLWLARRFAMLSGRSPLYQAVWICRLDGKNLRKLGAVRIPPATDVSADSLGELRWKPDGKYVSFTYKNQLWATAAN